MLCFSFLKLECIGVFLPVDPAATLRRWNELHSKPESLPPNNFIWILNNLVQAIYILSAHEIEKVFTTCFRINSESSRRPIYLIASEGNLILRKKHLWCKRDLLNTFKHLPAKHIHTHSNYCLEPHRGSFVPFQIRTITCININMAPLRDKCQSNVSKGIIVPQKISYRSTS